MVAVVAAGAVMSEAGTAAAVEVGIAAAVEAGGKSGVAYVVKVAAEAAEV